MDVNKWETGGGHIPHFKMGNHIVCPPHKNSKYMFNSMVYKIANVVKSSLKMVKQKWGGGYLILHLKSFQIQFFLGPLRGPGPQIPRWAPQFALEFFFVKVMSPHF